jgi:hypothetical protein
MSSEDLSQKDLSQKDLTTADLTSFGTPPNLTRNTSDSGYTDSGLSSRGTSVTGEDRSFFDDLNEEAPPKLLSTLPEGDEAVTPTPTVAAQGFSAAAAGPEDTELSSVDIEKAYLTDFSAAAKDTENQLIELFGQCLNNMYTEGYSELRDNNRPNDLNENLIVDRVVLAVIFTFYPILKEEKRDIILKQSFLIAEGIKSVTHSIKDYVEANLQCDGVDDDEIQAKDIKDIIKLIKPPVPIEIDFNKFANEFGETASVLEDKDRGDKREASVGGRRQTKRKYKNMRKTKKNRKNNKIYRGGGGFTFRGIVLFIIIIGIMTIMFLMYLEMSQIFDQYKVLKRQPVTQKLIEVIEIANSNKRTQLKEMSQIEFKGKEGKAMLIGPNRTVVTAIAPPTSTDLALSSNELATYEVKTEQTLPEDFLVELDKNADLFLKLDALSNLDPLTIATSIITGDVTGVAIEQISELVESFAGFLLSSAETPDQRAVQVSIKQLNQGFNQATSDDQDSVLLEFFNKCYPEVVGSDNPNDVSKLMNIAEGWEAFYDKIPWVRLQQKLPEPKRVSLFTSTLVTAINQDNEKAYITDPNTGVSGDQTPVNAVRSFLEIIPGATFVFGKADTVHKKYTEVKMTKEFAQTKVTCFQNTMKRLLGKRTDQLVAVKANSKVLLHEVRDMLGVDIVLNSFDALKPISGTIWFLSMGLKTGITLLISTLLYNRLATKAEKAEEKADNLARAIEGLVDRVDGVIANQLAIGNGQLAIGNGQLAIGNGYEGNGYEGNGYQGNAAGVLAIGNAPAPGRQPGGQQGNLPNLGASSLSSNSNVLRRGNYSENLGEQSFGSFGQDPALTSSNASSAAAAAPAPRSTTPGKKRWMAQKQAEENQGNSGGRTRRRTRKTKKRRRPIKRRQTRKLRRNTKRRRM